MKLEIFGPGCKNCKTLEELTKSAAGTLGIEFDLIKITDMNEIVSRGVMRTPALAIDGDIVLSGRVPKIDELIPIISSKR